VDALSRFVRELELGPVALVTHDWGVMVGLRWACEDPAAVRALVISDGGFFADRRWHDLANAMRTPGVGEERISAYTRDGFCAAMREVCAAFGDDALEEYWKGFADDVRRRGHLELYRSGDFEKLVPYEGRLAAMAVPALIVWGGQDRFASVKMAHRFHSELAQSELAVFEDAGHFVWDEEPERAAAVLVGGLPRRPVPGSRRGGRPGARGPFGPCHPPAPPRRHRLPPRPRTKRPWLPPPWRPSPTGCARWATCPASPPRSSPTWPPSSASRCSSRDRPGLARPSWPRRSPRFSHARWCAFSAMRGWTRRRRCTSGTTASSC